MSRFINPVPQFYLNNGDIASSGLMEFFENKDYSTKKDTYNDAGMTIKNINPLRLDGQGRMPSCFGEGLYSVKFYAYDNAAIDKKGELQWSRDDVDFSGGESGAFDNWSPVQTYGIGTIVKDDGNYYELYGANTSKGENPSTTSSKWAKIVFITEHIVGRTYETNDVVIKSGLLYRAKFPATTSTPPSSEWQDISFNNAIIGDTTISGTLYVGGSITTDTNLHVAFDLTGGYFGKAVRKTTLSIVSNTTLERDSDLTITGLSPGWYAVRGIIVWNSNSGGAANPIALTFDNDASTALQKVTFINSPVGAGSPTSSTSSTATFQSASSSDNHITFSGMVRLDTGNQLGLWVAQFASSATATEIKFGSLQVERIGFGV